MQTSNKPIKTRRKFDKEFKDEALRMVSEGQSSSSVARSLNVSEKLLYCWRKQQKTSANEQKSSQVDEVQQLKNQLKRVEMERDILKKALIIFGQST